MSLSKLTYEMCRYHRFSVRNKAKKRSGQEVGQKGVGKHLERGGVKKGPP